MRIRVSAGSGIVLLRGRGRVGNPAITRRRILGRRCRFRPVPSTFFATT